MEIYKIIFLDTTLTESLDWIDRHKFKRNKMRVDQNRINFYQIEDTNLKLFKRHYFKFQENIYFVFIKRSISLIEHQRKVANEILYLT